MSFLAYLVGAAACLLLVPATVFFIECLASIFLRDSSSPSRPADVSVAVLIPAHDEAEGIAGTVADVARQVEAGDRILVVADNCTDETAEFARGAGAEVIERHDPGRRGKGYALAFGVAHLEPAPPDLVIVIDADCRLTPGSIDALVEDASRTRRPVQADYISKPAGDSPLSMISALAMLVRNRVRPRGLLRLGAPCHLTGTGMGFPWPVMKAAPDLGDNLVEDLAMGIELALLGHEPLLCTQAGVRSALPSGDRAAMAQRRRWEHGQLDTLRKYGLRLVRSGIAERRPGLVAMGMDLLVPPLALVVALILVVAGASLVLAMLGGSMVPSWISLLGLGLVGSGVAIGWARYGRQLVPFRYLLLVPFYLIWKVPLYVSFFFGRREREWQRTER